MKIELGNWPYNLIDLNINDSFKSYTYIKINNDELLNKVFDIIHGDMQQGEKTYDINLGKSYISDMGFFDYYDNKKKYLSWKNFKTFLPSVIYKFNIKDDIIQLNPISYKLYKYNDIKDQIYII